MQPLRVTLNSALHGEAPLILEVYERLMIFWSKYSNAQSQVMADLFDYLKRSINPEVSFLYQSVNWNEVSLVTFLALLGISKRLVYVNLKLDGAT